VTQPHLYELARSVLIFLHLTSLIAAGVSIAFGDYAILRHRPINRDLMVKSSQAVAWSLAALWLTGLWVIAVDMSSAGLVLSTAAKLQAKLTVVGVLTLNGFLLHRYTLHALGDKNSPTESDLRLAAVLGAISAVSWGYAMFLGVARAWTPILGYSGFMALYAVALTVGIMASLRWVRPLLMESIPKSANRQHNKPKPNAVVKDDLTTALS
jgi:hypothetical protein